MMEEYKSSDGIATREFKRLRNAIRTHCDTINQQQQEIGSLTETVNFQEHCNDELKQKITELKAQISSIKRLADSLMDSTSGIDYSVRMDGLLDAIDKAPQQCLAEFKADAGKAGFYEGFSRSGEGFNDEHGCEPIELKTMAELYASELREQK